MTEAWHPISDPVDLKHLGKLGEELCEAGASVCRAIIQGMDGINPHGGQINREWLEDELADVMANVQLVIGRFNLNVVRMNDRGMMKMDRLEEWHKMA